MSWFSNRSKTDVHRTVNRLLNSTLTLESFVQVNADQRKDQRILRTLPVVILPLGQTSESELTVGLTQDLSCEGMALTTLGPLRLDSELAIGLGDGDHFTVLLCVCKRHTSLGFGFFESGIQIEEVLPARDFQPLREFAEYLEANPPTTVLSLRESNSFHKIPKSPV